MFNKNQCLLFLFMSEYSWLHEEKLMGFVLPCQLWRGMLDSMLIEARASMSPIR